MRRDDQCYFIRRAAEERVAAAGATCPRVAAAHHEMAARYTALAAKMAEPGTAMSA